MTVKEYIDFICTNSFRVLYENQIVYDSTKTLADFPAYIAESVVEKAYFDDPEIVEIEI